jgi:hypothetical protein
MSLQKMELIIKKLLCVFVADRVEGSTTKWGRPIWRGEGGITVGMLVRVRVFLANEVLSGHQGSEDKHATS